jgi:uroporphyrinogen decarboxylase
MTGLERLLACIEGKEGDRVPVCELFLGAAHRVYGARFDEFAREGEIAGKSWVESQKLIGFDIHVLLWDLTVEAHDFGQETEFLEHDTARPNYNNPLVTGPDDYDKIQPIEACVTGQDGLSRMEEYIKSVDIVMNEQGDKVGVGAFVFGTLGLLGMCRGAEKLFFDCVKFQEPVMKAQWIIADVLVDYIGKICKRTSPHGVCLDTLYASGGIMSKKLWNTVENPTAKKLADAIRAGGTTVWVHNCGNNVYFDAQIDSMDPIGISYAYVPDDCEDFADMKKKYGDKITLHGHIHPAERLFLGSREELLDEIKLECDTLKAGGRYILAPGCEFPPNGNLNRAMEIMEGAELHGKY